MPTSRNRNYGVSPSLPGDVDNDRPRTTRLAAGLVAAIGQSSLGMLGTLESSIEDDRTRGETVDNQSDIVAIRILLPVTCDDHGCKRSSRSHVVSAEHTVDLQGRRVEIFIRTQRPLRMLQLDVRSTFPPFSSFSVLGILNRPRTGSLSIRGQRRGQSRRWGGEKSHELGVSVGTWTGSLG